MRFAASWIVTTLLFLGLSGASLVVAAQDGAQSPAPDNTKVNQGDQNKANTTADQQAENKSDREIAQQIRQSVMSDKSLSTYAHNVKIISQNGVVTLKGPVRTDDEKRAIEAMAAQIVGQEKVTSQLEIKPKN